MNHLESNRRSFLKGTAGAVGGLSAAAVFQNFLTNSAEAAGGGFGAPAPVNDDTTGLPLIKLPPGFRYSTFGWTGDEMMDGNPTPPSHDGMAVAFARGSRVILVRNHEVRGSGAAFPSPAVYDSSARGGTTNLAFDRFRGEWIKSWPSISGTSTNCAGGPAPWGAWLTCEETMDEFGNTHGWVFEVPANARAQAIPLKDMGRFSHEAVAVDRDGTVYLTEDDRFTSGFYRFLPNRPNKLFGLQAGGTLQMLKVKDEDQATLFDVMVGDEFDVEWVTINDPELGPQTGVGPFEDPLGDRNGTTNSSGPFLQGWNKGGARFRRLEGAWTGDGVIYFDDTEGGKPASDTGEREGAVWAYDPSTDKLKVVFTSPAETVLDNPDNITVAPDGSIFLCEDGDINGLRIQCLTPGGSLSVFAVNDIVISGGVPGKPQVPDGDYRGREWAGATFEPSGEWLFVNIQTPGITFAITGPWPWLDDSKKGRRPVNR